MYLISDTNMVEVLLRLDELSAICRAVRGQSDTLRRCSLLRDALGKSLHIDHKTAKRMMGK